MRLHRNWLSAVVSADLRAVDKRLRVICGICQCSPEIGGRKVQGPGETAGGHHGLGAIAPPALIFRTLQLDLGNTIQATLLSKAGESDVKDIQFPYEVAFGDPLPEGTPRA